MIAPAVWGRLKAGVRAAYSLSGGKDGAAATVGLRPPTVATWHNVNDRALPRIDYAYLLDEVAVLQGKEPPILRAYAADLGYVAIRLPDGGTGDTCVPTALIDAAAEFGDIPHEVREALRDGKLCKKDREKIVRQIDESLCALVRLRMSACEGQ